MVGVMAFAAAMEMALFSSGPARADFVLGNVWPGGAPAVSSQLAPSLPEEAQDAPAQALSRFKVVQGFGDAVPLSFALRQIVPIGVKVRYGLGIDPQALVSWKGNRPWNQALAVAVRPLHLRLVTGTSTVLITR